MKKILFVAMLLMIVITFTSCKDKVTTEESTTVDTIAVPTVDSVETTTTTTVEVDSLSQN